MFGNKQKRFHFISAYSDALEEFYSSVQSELPANCATEILGERAYAWDSDSGSSACMRNMYFVDDKMLSKEEVVALAEAPPSDSQVQTNNERNEYSRQLFAVLESEECQVGLFLSCRDCSNDACFLTAHVFFCSNRTM